MTLEHYILNPDGSTKTVELLEWAKWMEENRSERIVAQTVVGDYKVSTVFLGLDHNFGDKGDPILFETMTFENKVSSHTFMGKERKYHKEAEEAGLKPEGEVSGRWRTKSEALAEHKKIVEIVKKAQDVNKPAPVKSPEA